MQLQPQHGVDWIIETLLEADDDSVTLCLFAPQTNIGMAFSKAPEVLPKVKEIVFMGGGFFEGGNITPAAEFNVYVDPHAAHRVVHCGRPVTMLSLDVYPSGIDAKKLAESNQGIEFTGWRRCLRNAQFLRTL